MPAKNSIKPYIKNAYYHVYNRGVEKRNIFLDQQDYTVFLRYLENYLLPKDEASLRAQLLDTTLSAQEKQKIQKQLRMNNFHGEITLLAYVLMPNHFHFFLKQKSQNGLDTFMNSLLTRYVMYFNKKYKRVGPLFQGVYKAVFVETEPYFLYLSAYIHRNPLSLSENLFSQPSSYPEYMGGKTTAWVHPEEILSYFSKTNPTLSYSAFVQQTEDFDLIRAEKIDRHDWPIIATSTRPPLDKVVKSSFFKELFRI